MTQRVTNHPCRSLLSVSYLQFYGTLLASRRRTVVRSSFVNYHLHLQHPCSTVLRSVCGFIIIHDPLTLLPNTKRLLCRQKRVRNELFIDSVNLITPSADGCGAHDTGRLIYYERIHLMANYAAVNRLLFDCTFPFLFFRFTERWLAGDRFPLISLRNQVTRMSSPSHLRSCTSPPPTTI